MYCFYFQFLKSLKSFDESKSFVCNICILVAWGFHFNMFNMYSLCNTFPLPNAIFCFSTSILSACNIYFDKNCAKIIFLRHFLKHYPKFCKYICTQKCGKVLKNYVLGHKGHEGQIKRHLPLWFFSLSVIFIK